MSGIDKRYDGMLKDQIAALDRIAKIVQEKDVEVLEAIYEERKLVISKLGYYVEESGLYNIIK
jgi:hypothetical protein